VEVGHLCRKSENPLLENDTGAAGQVGRGSLESGRKGWEMRYCDTLALGLEKRIVG
jgi:hypothetical protein